MKHAKTFILTIVAMLLLAGCQGLNDPRPAHTILVENFDPMVELEDYSFESIDELKSFVKKYSGSSYSGGGIFDGAIRTFDAVMTLEVAESAVADGGSASKTMPPIERDYSETNIQVVGVDEADIIKTDGDYIYTISGKTLFIIKAYPGEEAEIVSTLKFDNNPSSIFIKGNNLAVFGNYHNLEFFKEIDFTPRTGMTFLNVYDISDKEEPKLLEEYKFEGSYLHGRMVGDQMYLLSINTPQYRGEYPTPLMVRGTEKTSLIVDDVRILPIPYNNPQFITINSVNIKQPAEITSKAITVDGYPTLYMSKSNIYLAYTKSVNEWVLRQDIIRELVEPNLIDEDKALIEKIEATDGDVLSEAEKKNKIMQIINLYINYMDDEDREDFNDEVEALLEEKLEEYEYMEYTIIQKVNVENDDIELVANGKVPGHLNNQFSMDEFEDVLRVGTTVNGRWSSFEKERTESTNHVLTLDSDLDVLDHLADLAEGERIYSTRFMSDKLYMVTFRQVDPFFVIDLSNPENIKAMGELKIPGFSRYLHPYDENTIIGIGRDATEQGRTQGLKISLFDVSDFENPKEIAQFVTDERYASSTAEYEHKAFLFSKDKELLVIPAYYNNWQDEDESYNGAMVFKINRDEIELRGLIDHSASGRRYGSAVERSLYIENLLYTKSYGLLRINDLDDLSSVKKITLESNADRDIIIY